MPLKIGISRLIYLHLFWCMLSWHYKKILEFVLPRTVILRANAYPPSITVKTALPRLPLHLGQSVAGQCIACLAVEVSALQYKKGNLLLLKGWDGLAAEPAQKEYCFTQSKL